MRQVYTVVVEETTELNYRIEAESPEEAIKIWEGTDDSGERGDPVADDIMGQEFKCVENPDGSRYTPATRPRCTIKDGEIICPHCGEVTDPNIVEDTPVFWKHAEVAEGEQVICTYGASYEADPDGNDARLECGECSKGFNPPEGWEIDWR